MLDAELFVHEESTADRPEDGGLVSAEPDKDGDSSDEEDDSSEESNGEEEESDVDIDADDDDESEAQLVVENDGDNLEESSLKRRRKNETGPSPDSGTEASNHCPPHPGFIWNVCIRCGERKSTEPTNDPVPTHVGLRYIHEGLEVSELEASRVRNAELRRVNKTKKLLLVVDLDHTVLNSARFADVPVGELQAGGSSLHQMTKLGLWTKLRPFAHEFLQEASKLYEMYIYTMGERKYAKKMAKLLDPTRQLFADRIISQNDSTKRYTKDLDVVLGADSAVVILDDTEAVWPSHKSNLILMERYHFFSSSCSQFGVNSASLAQLYRDESETEGTLATTLKTLRAIHHEYFNGKSQKRKLSSDSSDVRLVIRSLRAKLLAGCNVVLGPEIHPFWQLPAELGARCSTFCDHTTTHVVALDPGTDQALWAKEHDVFLVHPRWVDATSYLWSRPPEEDYPVTENPAGPAVVTFAKNVLVEPLIVDDTSDKGEVEPLVDLEPSKDETVSQATNAVELSGSSCLELPPTHVNGLSDASSVEDEDLEIE